MSLGCMALNCLKASVTTLLCGSELLPALVYPLPVLVRALFVPPLVLGLGLGLGLGLNQGKPPLELKLGFALGGVEMAVGPLHFADWTPSDGSLNGAKSRACVEDPTAQPPLTVFVSPLPHASITALAFAHAREASASAAFISTGNVDFVCFASRA